MNEPKTKRLVILANSIKRNHYCVAGREILSAKGKWSPGLWTRPVDPTNEGAIALATMRFADGGLPRFLDIVEIPILKWANDPSHPEDWVVDASRPWRREGVFPLAQLPMLVERPPMLWTSWTDPRKVRAGYVVKMPGPATLYLIKPEGKVTAVVFREKDTKKFRQRLHLKYNGVEHEFDITDPNFESCYLAAARKIGEEPVEIPLPNDGSLHVCLSLTPEFHGAHYKIAATIWEAPPA